VGEEKKRAQIVLPVRELALCRQGRRVGGSCNRRGRFGGMARGEECTQDRN